MSLFPTCLFPMTFSILSLKAVVMDKKRVKDYMTYDVVSVDIHGTVKDVIEKIQKTHHDGFPVIDGEVVVGYISARDLLFVQLTTPVNEVVSRNLIVADPEMDINDAARVIFRSGIQKLPVVDEKNHLLGIISNSDVIRSQIEHVSPEKVFNFITTLKSFTESILPWNGGQYRSGISCLPSQRSMRMNWKGEYTRSKKDSQSRLLL